MKSLQLKKNKILFPNALYYAATFTGRDNAGGFDGKVLAQVLATYPRDELFQIDRDALFDNAMAITHIHERRRTRMFTRMDRYGLFVTCLVYVPRDLYNTHVRQQVQELLP